MTKEDPFTKSDYNLYYSLIITLYRGIFDVAKNKEM